MILIKFSYETIIGFRWWSKGCLKRKNRTGKSVKFVKLAISEVFTGPKSWFFYWWFSDAILAHLHAENLLILPFLRCKRKEMPIHLFPYLRSRNRAHSCVQLVNMSNLTWCKKEKPVLKCILFHVMVLIKMQNSVICMKISVLERIEKHIRTLKLFSINAMNFFPMKERSKFLYFDSINKKSNLTWIL